VGANERDKVLLTAELTSYNKEVEGVFPIRRNPIRGNYGLGLAFRRIGTEPK